MSASPTDDLQPIEVGWSSQRLTLRSSEEDWTGMTNPVERRKLQNRLNQRARRMRARDNNTNPTSSSKKSTRSCELTEHTETSSESSSSSHNSPISSTDIIKPGCMAAQPRVQALMRQFAEHAYTSYMQGTPALSHLSLLVKYNVSSALRRNADILGVTSEYIKWEGLSPFPQEDLSLDLSGPQKATEWPKNLHPTQLQRSIEHHPWVDVFPWPRVRDNMVQAFEHPDICDEDDMCRDVCEYDEHVSEPILVVWGDAWDPCSWEVTPEFLKKWGWLLSGCNDFLEATNYWRARRDEKPITPRQLYEAIQLSMPERLRTSVL